MTIILGDHVCISESVCPQLGLCGLDNICAALQTLQRCEPCRLPACLSVCLYLCLSLSLYVYSLCLFCVSLSVSVFLCFCLSVCLSVTVLARLFSEDQRLCVRSRACKSVCYLRSPPLNESLIHSATKIQSSVNDWILIRTQN